MVESVVILTESVGSISNQDLPPILTEKTGMMLRATSIRKIGRANKFGLQFAADLWSLCLRNCVDIPGF
jgi:hypothetical protein